MNAIMIAMDKETRSSINGYITIAVTLQVSVLLIRIAGTLIYGNFALLFESFHILTDLRKNCWSSPSSLDRPDFGHLIILTLKK